MKSSILFAAMAALMGTALSAHAADGTITITGEVTAESCQVTPIGGGAGSEIEVNIGSHAQAALATAGSFTPEAKFGFHLEGQGCQDGNVQFTWLGTNIDVATGGLRNTLAGTDAQARLVTDEGQPINLVTGANSPEIEVPASGGVDVVMGAQFVSPTGNATAGEFSSSVEFAVTQL